MTQMQEPAKTAPTKTAYTTGRMVWRELITEDVAKAKRFYRELFGWQYQDQPMGPDYTYSMIQANGKMIGGLGPMPPGAPAMPPAWQSYVSVKDVDAAAKSASESGGQVAMGPMDIPNVGRFATIMDPDRATITAFRSASGDPSVVRPAVGDFCWETLSTKDIAKAKTFYAKVFGWKVGDGGGMPTFGVGDGMENQVADIQVAQGPVPPHWLTFVVVKDADDAAARAKKLGGAVAMPGKDIPGIGRIAIVTDDQGAAIGLFQPSM